MERKIQMKGERGEGEAKRIVELLDTEINES